MKGYPGSKAGYGVYQQIINLIPPHDTYIETHLGSGAIMRLKRPADKQIGIELDSEVLEKWEAPEIPNVELVCTDAVEYLKQYEFNGREFVYADPPYLRETTRSNRCRYRRGYTTKQHKELLTCIKKLPCKVMISGYWSMLYSRMLMGWSTVDYSAQTRGGSTATETVWMNYAPPVELHDYGYLGTNFTDRQRIKRKITRLENRLEKMPTLERQAMLAAMAAVNGRDQES